MAKTGQHSQLPTQTLLVAVAETLEHTPLLLFFVAILVHPRGLEQLVPTH
jgi:hypothetical protein